MSPKLQTEILAICFSHQTGIYPEDVTADFASGYGYTLRWDEPRVVDTDPDREANFRIALEKINREKKKEPKRPQTNDLDKLVTRLSSYSSVFAGSYSKLEYKNIKVIEGKKAVLIDGEWLPYSQMKADEKKNIYLANWLFNKR